MPRWERMLTTDTSLGFFDKDSSALPGFADATTANSLRPRESTLEVTVCGKHDPRWATTQSKWGLCLTEVSNRDDTQASVSVLVRSVERQAAANSRRHRAAGHESQEDNLSCKSVEGGPEILELHFELILPRLSRDQADTIGAHASGLASMKPASTF